MKINKLYCNKKNFKNITFNLSGLSVVYADVIAKSEEKKNSHSLGKTKLSAMIDFLFLKGIDKNHFLLKIKNKNKESIFLEYIFYLELLLNNGKYLTIKRGVENNTKISFALNDASIDGYRPPPNWESENLAIGKAKVKFAEYLSLDFFKFKPYDYRKAISYSLRTPPADYDDVYQLSKFGKGKDLYWKPFMFDLLGFKGELLSTKYDNDKKREVISDFIETLKTEYSIKVEARDEYVAQMKLFEDNASTIEQQIDSFNFYEQDQSLIKTGIEKIETSISELNSESYNLNYEIERLRNSIKNKFAFDIKKVDKIFQEVELYFPDQLKKDYDSLIAFNNKLTTERNKLLRSTLKKKAKNLLVLNEELQSLNEKKENLLSYLKDTDSFRKFKYYQKDLVKVEGQLFTLREKINNIDKIITKEEKSTDYLKEIESTVKKLKKIFQSTEDNKKYSDIRKYFSSFYEKIMDENVFISWTINSKDNIVFIPPKIRSKDETKKETAKDDGTTYKKLLCVSFDLAILCAHNFESYFRFVYHDDVLSQQDNGIKIRLLELINMLTKKFDLQYILSVIKSDLPNDDRDNFMYFDPEEIVLKLHDKDESGTLFGFDF